MQPATRSGVASAGAGSTVPVPKVCPECAGPLAHGSGCVACLQCGWGRCG